MIRRLRLGSGLVMLAYVTMHLTNHALGLVSLDAMEWVLRGVTALWSQYPMLTLLYGAFLVHYGLALSALWQRRTLRLRASELLQLVLGFAIPILLARHAVANRIGASFFGLDANYYRFVLWALFVRTPESGYVQLTVLVVAWWHAMLGLYFWLRVRPWFGRLQPGALAIAVLFPVLALLGAVETGRQIAVLAAEPGWTATAFAHMRLPNPETAAALDRIIAALQWFFAGMIAAVLLARGIRRWLRRRRGLVRIAYPDGRFIEVVPGTSVLEASRLARIPHASVCGGRGRCSTCRVRVRATRPGLGPPDEAEYRVLRRIGAPPSVRLACQLRPGVPVEVTPLLPPFAQAADGARRVDLAQGREHEVAIMFVDIRGFTALAEGQLPYDVVFILNRYFAAMGHAIEAAGGQVDKFIGDGVMALFGVEGEVEAACRNALRAARLIAQRLAELNESLRSELSEPLRIAIAIHAGPAIVGEMGYGGAISMTAIGDAVNIASRLESLGKQYDAELVVSEEVVARAGLDRDLFRWEEVAIRGRQEMLAVAVVGSVGNLPERDAIGITATL
ncbi:MAG TPA: adenylate/guanylate cyclase domain-containing protein [Stellaceae bacterium]|nr:adenylate/guanylate cyclase domain-containing protein [Stellaceae bacterium]